MKKLVLSAFCFLVPIVGVIAMNPAATQQSLKQGMKWVQKSFPTPKRKPKVRRG